MLFFTKVFSKYFEMFLNTLLKDLCFVFTSIAEKYFVFVFEYFIVNLFCICIEIHLESILPKSASFSFANSSSSSAMFNEFMLSFINFCQV